MNDLQRDKLLGDFSSAVRDGTRDLDIVSQTLDTLFNRYCTIVNHARKMEVERDEARARAERLHAEVCEYEKLADPDNVYPIVDPLEWKR